MYIKNTWLGLQANIQANTSKTNNTPSHGVL